MFSTCNSACVGSATLTKTTQCDTYERSEVPVRFLIANCDFDFPTGDYDDEALAVLIEDAITAGDISATPELADVAWSDPNTTTKNYKARCRPASTIATSRVLTAKDFTATDKNAAGTSSPYEDRLFWQNKLQAKSTAIRGFITCDGKIYLFLNKNGTFASYSAHFFTGYDTEVDGKNVEFKNLSLTFSGDPVNYTLPYLDIVAANSVDTLGWLFQ